MNLFRKKEEKKTINRKTVIIIEVCCAVVLFLTLLGIKWLVTNRDVDVNVVKLENQVVENVSFVDFRIEYEEEVGNVTVSAINYTEEEIKVPSLKIKLYAADNNLISQIEVPEFTLSTNQEHLIENKILTTTKVASVEYVIE